MATVEPFIDCSADLGNLEPAARRAAHNGFRFFPGLLPPAEVLAVRRAGVYVVEYREEPDTRGAQLLQRRARSASLQRLLPPPHRGRPARRRATPGRCGFRSATATPSWVASPWPAARTGSGSWTARRWPRESRWTGARCGTGTTFTCGDVIMFHSPVRSGGYRARPMRCFMVFRVTE